MRNLSCWQGGITWGCWRQQPLIQIGGVLSPFVWPGLIMPNIWRGKNPQVGADLFLFGIWFLCGEAMFCTPFQNQSRATPLFHSFPSISYLPLPSLFYVSNNSQFHSQIKADISGEKMSCDDMSCRLKLVCRLHSLEPDPLLPFSLHLMISVCILFVNKIPKNNW